MTDCHLARPPPLLLYPPSLRLLMRCESSAGNGVFSFLRRLRAPEDDGHGHGIRGYGSRRQAEEPGHEHSHEQHAVTSWDIDIHLSFFSLSSLFLPRSALQNQGSVLFPCTRGKHGAHSFFDINQCRYGAKS